MSEDSPEDSKNDPKFTSGTVVLCGPPAGPYVQYGIAYGPTVAICAIHDGTIPTSAELFDTFVHELASSEVVHMLARETNHGLLYFSAPMGADFEQHGDVDTLTGDQRRALRVLVQVVRDAWPEWNEIAATTNAHMHSIGSAQGDA